MAELLRSRGIDLSGYRRSMLERRLEARMAALGISDPDAYLDRLASDPAEHDRIIEAISINVTSFFRNPVVWEILAQSVLRPMIEEKLAARQREIRVWSAGCASGEEAYSVAILLHEILRSELSSWKLHIFATDLSEEALRTATQAVYPRERMENTRLGILDQYFTVKNGLYELRPFVRRMVWFSRDDLTSSRAAPAESVYGTFDLVLCRNVLIYFARPLQERVLDKLTRSIVQGRYLVLGESEVLDANNRHGLRVVDRRNRIYQKPHGRGASTAVLSREHRNA
ncbi:MAG TPA: protein-glutamate O-methyltransferase CheR [Phycisphaerae bacterium]|nr:protein-glutamate O-methyltransferase CheR [Phycisphaerae bacterium]HOM52366.1 protein-glutamate O-methyltransferase CheR [Phycisphaerae bacterium]